MAETIKKTLISRMSTILTKTKSATSETPISSKKTTMETAVLKMMMEERNKTASHQVEVSVKATGRWWNR
ncbi:hypothetical protein ACFQH2_06060 [Natronoarchaeum sp. GCM10025703]|uniref:hypothetical protein n=1 Tax=Natronoarchaeum sp. GCM10025703 TaxID=3252685 RepID=UPI0036126907